MSVTVCRAAALITGSSAPVALNAIRRPSGSRSITPGRRAELVRIDALGELELPRDGRSARVISATSSTATRRPARMIPTRSQTALDLVEFVRGEEDGAAAPALVGDELVERLLHQRVEAAGRLVQDEQLGVVERRLHEADLLPVAARQLAERTVEVGRETLGQLGGAADAADPRSAAR